MIDDSVIYIYSGTPWITPNIAYFCGNAEAGWVFNLVFYYFSVLNNLYRVVSQCYRKKFKWQPVTLLAAHFFLIVQYSNVVCLHNKVSKIFYLLLLVYVPIN